MSIEVYETAVSALGTLISPRAARRMVDASLRAASRTPEDISASAMRRLLLGRIRQELQGVLPSGALDSGIKRVAAEVSALGSTAKLSPAATAARGRSKGSSEFGDSRRAPKEAAPRRGFSFFRRRSKTAQEPAASGSDDEMPPVGRGVPNATETPLSEALLDPATLTTPESVKRSSVYLPGIEVPESLRPPTRVQVDEASPPRATTRSAPATRSSAPPKSAPLRPATPGARQREIDEALTEAAVKAFAEVETVRQIVITKGSEVIQTRGGGVDAQRLAPLAVSTRRLLERAGRLRVYSIERPGGVLFLFPLLDGTVTVLTQPNVNIGAVLAARAALEEAA